MLKKLTSLDNTGDTIIEVIVVLAVLGLAIGISYATANRSLLNARQAQEHSQATAIVQSQIEALRTMTQTTPSIFQASTWSPSNCINQSTPYTVTSSCNVGSIPYQLKVAYTDPATQTFTVTATWPDVLGQGNDTVTMDYRLHQP